MARVPVSRFHQIFLEAVWPIGAVSNGSLITVETTDSTVCPHYDRQKLKCIKHSNPSSCRWKAGARRSSEAVATRCLTKAGALTVLSLPRSSTTPLSKMNECNQWGRKAAEDLTLKRWCKWSVVALFPNQDCYLNSFLQL